MVWPTRTGEMKATAKSLVAYNVISESNYFAIRARGILSNDGVHVRSKFGVFRGALLYSTYVHARVYDECFALLYIYFYRRFATTEKRTKSPLDRPSAEYRETFRNA